MCWVCMDAAFHGGSNDIIGGQRYRRFIPFNFLLSLAAPHLSVSQCFIIFLSVNQRLIIFLSVNQRFIIFLSVNQVFYLIFLNAKQALVFYSGCKPVLIFYSSEYETVSNFCFKTISYFFIIFWIILNMFQMLFLIMYNTSRYWPHVNLTMMTRAQ